MVKERTVEQEFILRMPKQDTQTARFQMVERLKSKV